ncbi:MAG: SPFH/Band 7/PHB domain protein [Clostridiales bacterium]|nr:SPFH/Band 7/PHB domain protein [Clostridiales bacterium]
MVIVILVILAVAAVIFFTGIRIVRPTHRGLVETLGKYTRFARPGFNWIIPKIQEMYLVNITEQMVDAEPQVIITNDNLNAVVDAQIYFRVRDKEEDVKAAAYKVNDYYTQIVSLARTTLRNIIGTMSLRSANSERGRINKDLLETLERETGSWGVDIIRAELKEIEPPMDVQETMNKVVKAENEKMAAVDFAAARETQADGLKRAEIKRAEAVKRGRILEAEGEAQAIRIVGQAANKYFNGDAQLYKNLQTIEKTLKDNSKFVIPEGAKLVNLVGDMAGIAPLTREIEAK